MWFLLLGLALFGVACIPRRALVIRTDFTADDPVLARLLKECAQEWADAGVTVASIVTVNENVAGAMPVLRAPRDDLWINCHAKQGPAYRGDGCTAIEDGRWDAIYIPNDLQDENRIRAVLMHELAHVFACTKLHLDPELVGIMHPNANSETITDADMAFMSKYTEVDDGGEQ